MVDITGANPSVATLAIDDIAFHNCSLPSPTAGNCAADHWKCPKNNICISRYVLCDGVNDCGDRSDEVPTNCSKYSVTKCTFETNRQSVACNWTQKAEDGVSSKWGLITSKSTINNMARMTGPLTDHTYRIATM